MTVFDVLRYPLSNPATIEQVRAIPRHILKPWYDYEWDDISFNSVSRESIVDVWIAHRPNDKRTMASIENLRQRIKDME